MDDRWQVACEVGVSGIQAGAYIAAFSCAHDVEHVLGPTKKEVRQHVFQKKRQAEFITAFGDGVDRFRCTFEMIVKLLGGRTSFSLRPWVKHQMLDA